MSTYVYAITRASHPLELRGGVGVGETPEPLRTVQDQELAAVLSDAPENLRAKRRDLQAHEEVLEALLAGGPILPMRFGMMASDDDTVRRELAANGGHYAELLTEVDGRVELNVKAFHREDAVLRELLTRDAGLRRTNEALREAGGGAHEARMEFGERVSVAMEERRAADSEQLLSILRPHAVRESLGPPVDGCFVNASFLVGTGERPAFETTVAKLSEEIDALIELHLYGPLPPYSFVELADEPG